MRPPSRTSAPSSKPPSRPSTRTSSRGGTTAVGLGSFFDSGRKVEQNRKWEQNGGEFSAFGRVVVMCVSIVATRASHNKDKYKDNCCTRLVGIRHPNQTRHFATLALQACTGSKNAQFIFYHILHLHSVMAHRIINVLHDATRHEYS